jgi:hypothetical protein
LSDTGNRGVARPGGAGDAEPAAAGPAAAAAAAGSRATGRELSGPVPLASSGRSVVLRCSDAAGGTVVVKTYPPDGDGPTSFATEAAGLTVTAGTGLAPRLLGASAQSLTVVMSDLGTGPSLADVLLGDDPAAARSALLTWTADCGALATAASGRGDDFETLKSRYLAGRPERADLMSVRERVLDAGERLARMASGPGAWLSRIEVPPGLAAELRTVADAVGSRHYRVFSPGDICPDNNLLTADGIRFLDFESAAFYPAFLDAAYLRMPFSSCWCVYRLPDGLAAEAEAIYRGQVAAIHPGLADDGTWSQGVRRAVAAWTLWTMSWLLPSVLAADHPMAAGLAAPGRRAVMRYRWQVLTAELDATGELPAVAELARALLTATEFWGAPDLPLYPAFLAAS